MRLNWLHNALKLIVLPSLMLLGYGTAVHAQLSPSMYDYPYNHLPWYTLESEHFLVHFQKGNSRSAQVASRIAEEVYPHITDLYNLEPDTKVSIVLNDRQDYSNGAAYFFDNQIEIWVPALNTPLRGTHNWLRDVIAHEFTHIIQLQASMKKSRRVPAIYFQWLSYEDVRRPDVLYGFPNGVITHPFASISIPAWLAEGTAQFQRLGWYYDTWDAHRDMILRTAIMNDTYLSFEEMGIFSSKTSLEREQAYNQGFAFTSYLVQRFGEKILPEISAAFSKPGIFNADEALKAATGTSGNRLFKEWIRDRKVFYAEAIKNIVPTPTSRIETEGFFNFYPHVSPDESKIAYLSNKGRDESRTSLYIIDSQNPDKTIARLDPGTTFSSRNYSCGFREKPLIDHIHSAFSFSPDGEKIVFTTSKLNRYGETYDDLFIYDLASHQERRLTHSQRLSAPAWHPDGQTIVAVRRQAGSLNLVSVDLTSGKINRLTSYTHGEQVYTPAWHPDGDAIYFAFSKKYARDIKRYDLKSKKTTTILSDFYTDYRDPFIDSEGLFLYYASDKEGIFNIYRMPVGGSQKEKLTNVTGGAFMPVWHKDRLIFSEYQQGGYKISFLDMAPPSSHSVTGSYQPPMPVASLPEPATNVNSLNDFDDSDIEPLPESFYSRPDTAAIAFSLSDPETPGRRKFYDYQETFTSLSFYPVLRFDNYSKRNGNNGSLLRDGKWGKLGENLWRDFKLGAYISSREVIDRLTIFGGALFGPGSISAEGIGDFFSPSRLTDLDRDLFLITEFQGLPFIKKRWSPTVSIELYNLRRNVNNGLSFEEFPCTACLPDTLKTDIAYNIWEADLFLRGKINEHNLVELGVGYTPYRVQTDGFFSRELQQFIPSSSTEYFRGSFFSATHVFEAFRPYRHSDIAPLGLRTFLQYAYEPGRLLEDYQIEGGTLSPVYQASKNHSVEASTRYGFKVLGLSTARIYSRLFSYLNDPDNSFYLDYIGGFTGMRSYPFFALGGTTTAFGQLSYTFPLITDINKQAGRYTLDKLFLRFFTEAGTTWNSPLHKDSKLKTGIGSEVRFAFNSYYLFPLKLFVSTSYGFNQFDVTLPDEFITETPTGKVSYGQELLFHFGLTFDFDVLNHD